MVSGAMLNRRLARVLRVPVQPLLPRHDDGHSEQGD